MKKPGISTKTSDPELVGAGEKSIWVQGRNCVYRDDSVARYRVSIKTATGWKSYGHFQDLETAAYVANVAILAEGCEERYELNNIGTKDRQELIHWRSAGRNASLEQLAREKHERVQIALAEMRAEELRLQKERTEEVRSATEKARAEAEKAQARLVAKQKERDEKEKKLITEAPSAILLDLLTRDISGEQHRKIRAEIERRRGTKGAT